MDVSVVVPAWNRVDLLRMCLVSLEAALEGLDGEIIIVDDGSDPPLQDVVAVDEFPHVRLVRQENSGSAVARHRGIIESRGEYVLLSDSDDLLHRDKLRRHLDLHRANPLEISYSNQGTSLLQEDGRVHYVQRPALPVVRDGVALLLGLRPIANNLFFNGRWLRDLMRDPIVPPTPEVGPAGDYWIVYNIVHKPARVGMIADVLCYQTMHESERYLACWEKLGVAGLLLQEAFLDACPVTHETEEARRRVGVQAFESWRRLPADMDVRYAERLLRVWRKAPSAPLAKLGGSGFRTLAALLGPERAGRVLKRYQRPRYDSIRTLPAGELAALLDRTLGPNAETAAG